MSISINMKRVFVLCLCLCDTVLSSQEIGDPCATNSGESGICVSQIECQERYSTERISDYFETCHIKHDGTPVICCIAAKNCSSSTSKDEVQTRFYFGPSQNPKPKKVYSYPSKVDDVYQSPQNGYYERPYYKPNYNKPYVNDIYSLHGLVGTQNYDNEYVQHSKPSSFNSAFANTRRPTSDFVNFNNVNGADSNYGSNLNSVSNSVNSNKPNYNNGNSPQSNYGNSNSGSSSSNNVNRPQSNYGNSNNVNGYKPNNMNSVNRPQSTNYENSNSVSSNRPSYINSENSVNNGVATINRPWTSSQNGNGYTTKATTTEDENQFWGAVTKSTTRSVRNPQSTTRRTNSGQQQKRISEQKCDEYSKLVTHVVSAVPLSINSQATSINVQDCPVDATSLIVGGSKANAGEFPHMAALGFRSGRTLTYNCGGTLISENYVMTAAHCTQSSLGNPVHVRLGDLNLESSDDGVTPQNINVAEITVHPNYKAPQLYNDIALIRLERNVSLNKMIRPACLQSTNDIKSDKVIATGWGSTNYGEVSSSDLLKVSLTVINNSKCNSLYGTDTRIQNGITSTMMCAGDYSGKKDTCQGDSGGPIGTTPTSNKCIHYVVGVTSFGRECAVKDSPGIYTRVSEYVSWIENIVWKSNY